MGNYDAIEEDGLEQPRNVNTRKQDICIIVVCAIFSFIFPFVGFFIACCFCKTHKLRAWICFGINWIPTLAWSISLGWLGYYLAHEIG